MKDVLKFKSCVWISRSGRGFPGLIVTMTVISLMVTGCEPRIKDAVGDRNQIIVYSDQQNWMTYGQELERIFQREVETPRPESIFNVHHLRPDDWRFLPRFKNLVICAPLGDLTPTAERVRELLSPEVQQVIQESRRALHVVEEDPFSNKQIFLIITADSQEHLLDYLESHRETLFRLMEERLDERVSDLIYRADEQYALEDTLLNDYQFTMRIPWGFRMNTEYASDSFIRMIKYGPERWFFAYWVPLENIGARGLEWAFRLEELGQIIDSGRDPDPAEIRQLAQRSWDFRDDISKKYYDNDYVLRHATTSTIEKFQGRWAIRHYGRWQIDESFAGGPLVAYCFIDPETRCLWWLDGAVFYPNEPKETYLRQLDVMINTFMTGSEADDYIASIQEYIDERR